MQTFLQDLKYALRMLKKNPAFTAVAILTLAVGIGANSAIFSVVNSVLLRPLPYQQPGQLVRVYSEFPTMQLQKFWLSAPELLDIQRGKIVGSNRRLGAGWSKRRYCERASASHLSRYHAQLDRRAWRAARARPQLQCRRRSQRWTKSRPHFT